MTVLLYLPPSLRRLVALVASTFGAVAASAGETRYTLDPTHTYRSFEADHSAITCKRGKRSIK